VQQFRGGLVFVALNNGLEVIKKKQFESNKEEEVRVPRLVWRRVSG